MLVLNARLSFFDRLGLSYTPERLVKVSSLNLDSIGVDLDGKTCVKISGWQRERERTESK